MHSPRDIIAAKRSQEILTQDQIETFVSGLVDGSFKDYQASALLMAIVLNGMNVEETTYLTDAMMRSGRVIELPEITRPKIDKHSTGGVGDKISLILAPIAAAVGICVPMISGRGLGHTGGTLDKLDSIPGFKTQLSEAAYRAQLQKHYLAIIGQSKDMVPADRMLYALRDVTATVESVPLIVSSILSKKLAAGIDGLVLDVKCGQGAFMKTEAEARKLASALISTSHQLGKPTRALITRMDEPLGYAVGNSLEVIESIECLKGNGPKDIMYLTRLLVAHMIEMAGLCKSIDEGITMVDQVVEDGSALKAFADMVVAQGGDGAVVTDYSVFVAASQKEVLIADGKQVGYVSAVDALAIGEAAHILGAGRSRAEDTIDPSVGIVLNKKVGDSVVAGDLLATIHLNDSGRLLAVKAKLKEAFQFSSDPPKVQQILIDSL
jgi:pyrimidine-nucleoside phosphorylase